ncbi:hypothetical protein GCM10008932_01970 [Alkalibacterium iburiense]|uniref:Competence protein ComGG n=1 Tax=Alkalibacterium iburiense TaxID=290589 RepID=A0ABN0X188_9LACT
MNLKQDDQGSILVSTFALLLFISFLITSASLVIKHQVVQYNLISQTYEAKAMIEMTKQILVDEDNEAISSGSLAFSNGTVTIKQTGERKYSIEATLNNNFTSRSVFILPEAVIEETTPIDEDTYFDE